MTAEQRQQLADQIRNAISSSSMSRYEISKRSGVDESSISRFMNRKGSLSFASIERLAAVLHLAVVVMKEKKPKKK